MQRRLLLLCVIAVSGGSVSIAADGHPAVNAPDRFAWDVFARICSPANNGSANDAVWETWATDEETFPSNPVAGQPPAWPGAARRAKRLVPSRQLQVLQRERARAGLRESPRISEGGTQEVRRNQPAFDFIVAKELWHLDGLMAAAARGEPISFPVDSIEIKASWKPIAAADKPKYHWNMDGRGDLYGLTALHITTKDLPNWFWATFEHVDNPNRGSLLGCHDSFGVTPANSCSGQVTSELQQVLTDAGLPAEWQNYRLVDSQVDFIDSTGRALIVANSEIEGGFELSSSCTTCHARAAINTNGDFLPFFFGNPIQGHVGPPDPDWFYNANGSLEFLQLDFVWGFMFASPLSTGGADRSLLISATDGPTLTREEARVAKLSQRKSRPAEASELQDLAVETARYAERIGGNDDRRVVEVFRNALNLAAGPAGNLTVQPELELIPIADDALRLPDLRRFTMASGSIYQDERYIKNARAYLRSISERIVGGTETSDFPECVAVGSASGWCCSGTLIAPNVVLTAGHCDGLCASRVLIGSDIDNSSAEVIGVANAVQHPDYNTGGLHHDLTVLVLERDVGSVTPCRIADEGAINGANYVRAVGFGTVDRNGSFGYGLKRQVDIPIASINCSAAGDPGTYGCDPDLELIAGQPFLNRDTCSGDSGGPVYILVGGEWHLAGATSRATANSISRCGDGGVYVRVDRYLDWIRTVPGGHWPN